ncbi:16S rRNA (guanine(966)-N(2))-methyltransferase RsmD [Enterobacteriaceae endosymbiont of Donacia cincticornis]|uniref:16S rRNA (guanine(966)-N(2))-methyltransferase RsmD n=1 Tax=Enterobacteriaceae endosymbiont of Donacia cincticornis TaxID=2675773 RepID=UPI001448F75C|nr:16S rRNA (guanine(966)-N(2))-methyltransferase RsmD [Enterobacteriaceae endosymbiont of Donacia cincticornis]QJC35935.1 16S rRNA (guanine(966)-N(2))-methyltransferase RsmD [Enterobacteriaceae endosymbiont of Donacia cincticornis]
MKNKKNLNKINIIAGKWKNKKIKVINNKILKPTMNFIRENLFNWIMHDNYFNCLDCYAGTGILSFEAISRKNVYSATLIENNKKIFQQLKKNVYFLTKNNISLIFDNTLKVLSKKSNIQYDLIFIDPPFCQKNILLKKTCILLEKNNWLKNNTKIFIQYKTKSNKFSLPKKWIKYRQNKFGIVTYLLCKINFF